MSDSFWTGFANSLTSGIEERRGIANDYFERQLEIAQTTGLANRNRIQEQVSTNLRFANQLEQMGVPKHVIMEQASANPEGLATFYDAAINLQTEANRPITAEDWEGAYTAANSMKGQEQDFSSFFTQMYSPMANAIKNDSEGFRRDPRGSIWAAMFAADPYGSAQRRLDNTEVIDGMSAGDLLRQGDSTFNPPGGENVVTPNIDVMKDLTGEDETVRLADRQIIGKTVQDTFTPILTEKFGVDGFDPNDPESIRKAILEAGEQALSELEGILVGTGEMEAARKAVNNIINSELRKAGIPVEPKEGAVMPSEGEVVEKPLADGESGSEESPDPLDTDGIEDSIDEAETRLNMTPEEVNNNPGVLKYIDYRNPTDNSPVRLELVKVNEDGTATYINIATGEELTYPLAEFIELSKMSRQ